MQIQPAWRSEAEKLLEEKGVIVSKFASKTFRGDFFRTIGHVYWNKLIALAQVQNLDDKELAKRLGLVGSTSSRWETGANPAGPDKFFAVVLLVLKRELNELLLGNRKGLLFDAVSLQLERLATEYHAAPSCKLDRFMMKSVFLSMDVPEVNDLVPNSAVTTSVRKKSLTKVIVSLNKALERNFHQQAGQRMNFAGRAKKVEPSQLDEWLASWGIAYTLFAMGCEKVTTWGIENVAD